MKTHTLRIAHLGDLIVAAFDVASTHSADPREVSRLATSTVARLLRHARRTFHPLPRRLARTTGR